MKTLYLHIGHYKTGTSAIQAYLSKHADDLRDAGFLYPAALRPKNNDTNHGCLSLALGREHGFNPPPWYKDKTTPDAAFAALRAEALEAPEANIIVSSEEFVQLALLPPERSRAALTALKEGLADFDVRPVLYVREPFSLLKSWYNEVNKGPAPTRTFPTFLKRVKNGFLGQHRIWAAYAKAFGADAIIVRSYKLRGSAHIQEFLEAVGCGHVPPADLAPVNEAQTLEKLELRRLQKAQKAEPAKYERITVTDIGTVPQFISGVDKICQDYARVAARSDADLPCQLTPAGIIDHYCDLLRPAAAQTDLNPAEAEMLRGAGLEAAKRDLDLARALMAAALVISPEDRNAGRKLKRYQAALNRRQMPLARAILARLRGR